MSFGALAFSGNKLKPRNKGVQSKTKWNAALHTMLQANLRRSLDCAGSGPDVDLDAGVPGTIGGT